MSNSKPGIAEDRASSGTMIAFGTGNIAVGVKNSVFGSWLMLYYNQVQGLEPSLAGAALAIALVFDAITDPLVGVWSDRTRTRWGRRHPFMYASIVPFSVAIFFILQPMHEPSQQTLFLQLLFLAIAVRVSMTLFDVPRAALGPELTKDYDQRTMLVGISTAFGWLGGAGLSAVALGMLFPETAEYSGSRAALNPTGFHKMGSIAAIIIFISAAGSTLALHKQIPKLHVPKERAQFDFGELLSEIKETLSNRSWVVVFLAGLVFALFIGLQSGVDYYYNVYFWEWIPAQIKVFPIFQAFTAITCGLVTSIIARGRDKKKLAVKLFIFSIALGPLPVGLRLLSGVFDFPIFPANQTDALWWILLIHSNIMIMLSVTGFVLIGSMVADIVEDSQETTGRRSEGLLTAGPALAQKTMSASGVFITGVILSLIGFDVPNPTVEEMRKPMQDLALTHVVLGISFPIVSTWLISKYTITRDAHLKTLKQLGYTHEEDDESEKPSP
jgi:Na+/melibiose symporter-like transporter